MQKFGKQAFWLGLAVAAGVTAAESDALALNACPRSQLRDDVVIIPVKASDTPTSEIVPRSTILADAQKVRDWYKESSFGCYVPDIWVDDTQTLPNSMATYCPNNSCTGAAMRDAIGSIKKAREALHGDSNASMYMVFLMGTKSMPIPFEAGWSSPDRGKLFSAMFLHELSHLLSFEKGLLSDFGAINCRTERDPYSSRPWDNATISAECSTSEESGDVATPMGVAHEVTQLTGPEKWLAGFMESPKLIQHIRFGNGVNQTHSYKLYSSSKPTTQAPQLLRLKLLDDQVDAPPYFYIEYRTQVGSDSAVGNQVYVYLQPTSSKKLFYSGNGNTEGIAKVGVPFFDPATKIKVTVKSMNADFADISVEMPGYKR
jgi:hypothetical protein